MHYTVIISVILSFMSSYSYKTKSMKTKKECFIERLLLKLRKFSLYKSFTDLQDVSLENIFEYTGCPVPSEHWATLFF